jgi:hypothetical protein
VESLGNFIDGLPVSGLVKFILFFTVLVGVVGIATLLHELFMDAIYPLYGRPCPGCGVKSRPRDREVSKSDGRWINCRTYRVIHYHREECRRCGHVYRSYSTNEDTDRD